LLLVKASLHELLVDFQEAAVEFSLEPATIAGQTRHATNRGGDLILDTVPLRLPVFKLLLDFAELFAVFLDSLF
jgi:hypothetical protein